MGCWQVAASILSFFGLVSPVSASVFIMALVNLVKILLLKRKMHVCATCPTL